MSVRITLETRSYSLNDGEPRDPDNPYTRRNTVVATLEGVIAELVFDGSDNDDSYFSYHDRPTFELNSVRGDTVYVVIAQYSTGNTFGRSEGELTVLDAFEDADKAHELKNALLAPAKKTNGLSEYERTVNGKKYYMPWVGYFELLNDLSIHAVVVGEELQHGEIKIRYW